MAAPEQQTPGGDIASPSPTTARRLALLGLVPVIGVLLFAAAGGLALRAFAHNNSLSCDGTFSAVAGACSHYSYALPVALGVVAVLLVMGGGAFASYYVMRNVGLPLLAALRRRA